MKKRITFDFETRSECELRKTGAYKYSIHPSTQPTCLAFKVSDSSDVHLFKFQKINQRWADHETSFKQFWQDGLIEGGFEFSAHNAFFERCIYENILVKRLGWPKIPLQAYRCTAAKAAACALPRNLQDAGMAMKLSIQKDRRGYAAMMATCKPQKSYRDWMQVYADVQIRAYEMREGREKKFTPKQLKWIAVKAPKPPMFLEPQDAPDVWKVLYEYCVIDVKAEEALDDALPDLNPDEQELWFLNQTLNWRGLRIDIPTVNKVVGIMAEESEKKLVELDTLTMGLVTSANARQSVLDFLALEGIELPNLQAKTVDEKLKGFELSEDMHRVLQIRKALSMTSTKKYQTFLDRAGDDHRVRDIILYHGASTGRDTGVGIQPHNFPRGLIKVDYRRPYAAVENVIECDAEMLRLLYGESLGILFSSVLRNMIIASEGCEIFVADFSKIEVAVLWWLSGNMPGLKILRAGMDPYLYMAAANTGRPYQSFNSESPERNLGKAQVLGCGFGMGADKFKLTAANSADRIILTDEQAKIAVTNYRQANPTVPALWKKYENAAVQAVEMGRGRVNESSCKFFMEQNFLRIELPSKRKLFYRDPQIAWRETEYGPRKTLEFWGVNSKTKKWAIERTWGGTLTENIVQAVARDLMMTAILNLEKAHYRALLTVHDEAICEKKIGQGDLDEFREIMCTIPPWGEGLPVEAKGWKGPRYRK